MQVDGFFDHARIDVISTAQDEVLQSVDQEKVTLIVHVPHVTRAEPAIAQAVGRFFRTIKVAPHDLWPLDPDFTALPNSHSLMRGFEIMNRNLGAWHDLSDGPRFVCIGHGITSRDRRGFTQAVPLNKTTACQPFEGFLYLERQRSAA